MGSVVNEWASRRDLGHGKGTLVYPGEYVEYKFKQFNIKDIQKDATCVFIGMRRAGKTTIMKDILYHNQDIPFGLAFCGSPDSVGNFSGIIPPILVYDSFNTDMMNGLFAVQEYRVQAGTVKPACLIIDDLMYDEAAMKSQEIRKVFTNGRHYKLLTLLSLQYALGVQPALRSNIDYTFIMNNSNSTKSIRTIWENYAGMFPCANILADVLNVCTDDYKCLVIKNSVKSKNIHDKVFWYRAKIHEPFRVCSDKWWRLNDAIYDKWYYKRRAMEAIRKNLRVGSVTVGLPERPVFLFDQEPQY